MCLSPTICTELGPDPAQWDTHAPLPHPSWHEEALRHFADSVALAASGKIVESLAALSLSRGDELLSYFDVHAQNSWHTRLLVLGNKRSQVTGEKASYTSRIEKAVYERDGYRCRYCRTPVVHKDVFKAYSSVVGADHFRAVGRNRERHGVSLTFRATVDHVQPLNLGGTNDESNLVTSCAPCNFGKGPCTVEQIGIENPFIRSLEPSVDWHGLTEFLNPLKRQARLRP